jgi:hypothetical protein
MPSVSKKPGAAVSVGTHGGSSRSRIGPSSVKTEEHPLGPLSGILLAPPADSTPGSAASAARKSRWKALTVS